MKRRRSARVPLTSRAVKSVAAGGRAAGGVSYVPDAVQDSVTGLRIVHLQQHFHGIPVYQARRAVRFSRAGREVSRVGMAVSIPPATPTFPRTKAEAAVEAAITYLVDNVIKGLVVGAGAPELVYQFTSPPYASVLRKAPFDEPLTCHLSLYRSPRGSVRLAWSAHLRPPLPFPEYEVLVSADRAKPGVLTCRTTTACAVSGHVFEFDPNTPVAVHPFPRGRADYPLGGAVPAGFPGAWVEQDATSGNNVICHPGGASTCFTGAATAAGTLLQAAVPDSADEWMLNTFHVCNLIHDFFYLLGFDEKAGNFQKHNSSGLGKDNDRLVVRCFDTTLIRGGGRVDTVRDGRPPLMRLGRVTGTPPAPGHTYPTPRHTALDAGVVMHEYVHAVTSRLVGGRQFNSPLAGRDQPEAMSEGYSDFFALTILNHYRRAAGLAENWAFGTWVANEAAAGLRPASYLAFPGTYHDLADGTRREPHAAGQVWCAALLDVRTAWISLLGGGAAAVLRADELAWRVVLASLDFVQVTERLPHFLHGRDALLEAFDLLAPTLTGDVAGLRTAIRDAFTARGMGAQARSSSTSYAGITAHP